MLTIRLAGEENPQIKQIFHYQLARRNLVLKLVKFLCHMQVHTCGKHPLSSQTDQLLKLMALGECERRLKKQCS